jgi:hypothetical protein
VYICARGIDFDYISMIVLLEFGTVLTVWYFFLLSILFCIGKAGGVMVSVLCSSAVDREFEPRSGQTKDYKISICCFSAKHAALRRKSKDWSARNQNNVSE